MKYTCGLCYPRVKKYLSSIQEGHDHAREHFNQMRVDNDELTAEAVHRMCFPRPRLWVEPRPVETVDIDVDEPPKSSEHVRESVKGQIGGSNLETGRTIEGISSMEIRPMETDETQNGIPELSTLEDVRESVEESSVQKTTAAPGTDHIKKYELIRQRRQIYARIRKYVRDDRLECRWCRKKVAIMHRGVIHDQNVMRHVESHLGIRYYKCAVCSKAYYNRWSLIKHLASCHKGVTDGVIDESKGYSEQLQDMLVQCFDRGDV